MSVTASLASDRLGKGRDMRLFQLSVYGNRTKNVISRNSMFSRAQVLCWRRRLVLLQKGPVPFTSPRWCCVKAFAASGAEMGVRRRGSPGQLGLDAFLPLAEVVCVVPSVVFAVGGIVGTFVPGMPKLFQMNSRNVLLVWQFFFLVAAVVVGGWMRQRQWQRISRDNMEVDDCDLVRRIEKVEEDLRSSVKIIRVLSRQLEKLGVRFRVTRKALKDPIAEAAVSAQKNSEATRALALQGDILEKELGEIQKVLLTMQEQQEKQLELILAVAKAGTLTEKGHDLATNGVTEQMSSVSLNRGLEQTQTRTQR